MGDMTVVRQETTRWSRIDRRGFEKISKRIIEKIKDAKNRNVEERLLL